MGFRPNIPENMPKGFRSLMVQCWDVDADKRPPFEEVLRQLQVSSLTIFLRETSQSWPAFGIISALHTFQGLSDIIYCSNSVTMSSNDQPS